MTTAPAKLVAGLDARRRAGGGPIAIVSCDNLPANGAATREVVIEFAELIDPGLAQWITEAVSFPNSMVDRITPRPDAELSALVKAATGADDDCPVVTEPFSEWVISGAFPAGRPQWDQAGVTFTDDIEPHERRKLLLLNGAHSLLAYSGLARGHATVSEAIADPTCRAQVESWWDEARPFVGRPDEAAARLLRPPDRPLAEPADRAPADPDRRRRIAEAARPARAGPEGRPPRPGRRSASSPPGSGTCANSAARRPTRRWPKSYPSWTGRRERSPSGYCGASASPTTPSWFQTWPSSSRSLEAQEGRR